MPALTVAAVRKYAAQVQRREIRDSLAPGLFLVVQPRPTGHKSWAMRFRRPDGRPAKLTLGRVDLSEGETADEPTLGGALTLRQARQLANKIDRERARGVDVVTEHHARRHRERTAAAETAANTFAAAARQFFADHKVKRWGTRPRRWRGDARLLGLDWPRDCDPATTEPRVIPGGLADRWRDRAVADVDDDDVYTVVDEARRHGVPGLPRHNRAASDARGRKMHGALSVLFRWLLKHRKVRSNPCVGVERPGAPPPRARVLSDNEIRWFWRGCEKLGAPYGPLLQVALLTGARLAEVTGMQRAELSEDDATWTVPGERAKNHRPNLLPLPPQVQAMLDALPRIEGSPLVFTHTGKKLTGFSRAKAQLDDAMLEVAREEDPAAAVPPWRIHDLRRTCSTGMHALGVPPHVVEAVLNHVSGARAGVAGVYNLAEYGQEKQAALARWAVHVQGLVTGKPATVVSLPKRVR
jgi:integrase